MQGIKSSLVASVLSRGWSAALTLALVPFSIRYLGIEAYGIVGIFASISATVVFLDLGLGPTLVRILNNPNADGVSAPTNRNALRTFEIACACVAIALMLFVVGLATPISTHWISVNDMTPETAGKAIAISGLALAAQWPSSLYSSGLTALNKQTQLAVLTFVASSIKFLVTIATIHFSPTLFAFFIAQIISNAAQTALLRTALWNSLPRPGHRPRFDASILRDSIGFAGGMTGITLTSIALTQADRFVLSKALDLKTFAAYVLAATLASGLYIIISPIYSVMYPRLAAAWQANNTGDQRKLYRFGAETIALMTFPLAITGAIYSSEILRLWTQDQTIGNIAGLTLGALLIGNMFNGIMNMPYALQIASGWTKLTLYTNLVSIIVVIPCLWIASRHHGMVGAACVWLTLNCAYLLITPSLVHKKILKGELALWYWSGVLRPLSVTLTIVGIFLVLKSVYNTHIPWFAEALLLWASMTVAVAGFSNQIRPTISRSLAAWATRVRLL